MFGSLRKIIGNINIVQKGNHITIEGLPSETFMNDIYKLWRTSKIEDYMFTRRTSASVTFHQFFLPDVLFTLETVLKNPSRGQGLNYRALRKVVDKIKEETWMSRVYSKQADILDFSQVSRMNITPLEHQDRFLHTYNDRIPRYNLKGYMLGAVPGSGKTIMGLLLGCCLKSDVVVMIVPKNSVDSVWQDTIATRFKTPVKYWCSTMKGDPQPGCSHYVFHYEQLQRAIDFFTLHKPKNPLIILDESHNFNEADSLRSQLLVSLGIACDAKNVLWASGTPIKAIGNEAITFLSMIDPYFDDNAKERFKKIFGKNVSRAVEILANRIGYLTFKVDKAVVIKNEIEYFTKKVSIPNGNMYTLDTIKAEMSAFVAERMAYYESNMRKYRAQYDQGLDMHAEMIQHDKTKKQAFALYKQYIEMIRHGYDPEAMKMEAMYCNKYEAKEIIPYLRPGVKEQFKNAKSVVKYYNLKVQGEALGRILGKKRTQCNVDMVPFCGLAEEIDGARKKTVIFTSYVEVVDKIAAMLEEQGYKPLRVYGETNKDLPNIVKKFENDEDANPLIATYQSLSTAVPLVMASTSIMMNSPYRDHELVQARARTDRIGQDGPVTFIDIFLETGGQPNISTRSGDILTWSREAVAAIMGTPIVDGVSLESFKQAVNKALPRDTLPVRLAIELYQEEAGGTFEADGVFYDLNEIFKAVDKQPIEQIDVSKLEWVLEFDAGDPKRLEAADLKAPILVTAYQGKELAVDGLHRLRKAVNENVTKLPYRRVSDKVMKDCIVEGASESIQPTYMNW